MGISEFNQRLADDNRHRENKARLAHVYHRVRSTGMGTVEFNERVNFGLTFVERPFIACGWQITEDGDDAETMPLCTGYVTEWDTTDRDHYVGCWVAVTVATPFEMEEYPDYKISHDFTFSGIALKDIPSEL